MVEIPDSLVERLKERQVVLIAGLGCSELAGAPGWNELMETLASRLVFSDARQVVTRLTTSGRMTDAIAFIRDQLPHQLVEEDAGQSVSRRDDGAGRDGGLRPLPVARGRDHLVRRSLGARVRQDHRHPPPAVGPDRGRRSRAGAVDRAAADCTCRAGSPRPRASAWDRQTRAFGWCRRRGSPGWRTWRGAGRSCSSASAPPIRIWCGCRRGWRRGRARRPTSCSSTYRRIRTPTRRCRCGR